jgi:hypothetical protein
MAVLEGSAQTHESSYPLPGAGHWVDVHDSCHRKATEQFPSRGIRRQTSGRIVAVAACPWL